MEGAGAAFEQALALSDTTAKYHFNLGAVYAKLGDLQKAKFHWQEALRLDPNYKKARKFLRELARK